MISPPEFNELRKDLFKKKIEALDKSLKIFGWLRLITFLTSCALIYFFIHTWTIYVPVFLIGTALFLFLVSKYANLKYLKEVAQKLMKINIEEIRIRAGDFYHRSQGISFADSDHAYCQDIDLFGKGSFFQYLNRTEIPEGTFLLAQKLKSNSVKDILLNQKAIAELASKQEWCQQYAANAQMIKVETPAKAIIKWLNHYHTFIPGIMSWLPLLFSFCSLGLFVAAYFNLIPFSILVYWFIIGLLLTGAFVKKVHSLSLRANKLKDTFRQYGQLLALIENESFLSQILNEQKNLTRSKNKKASTIFNELSKKLDALDQRNNMFFGILGNGLLLWDLNKCYAIEKWIIQYRNKVSDWFKVVSFFDCYNTLGTYCFNHPDNNFPSINNSNTVINAIQLGHPLIKKSSRITNDFKIDEKEFHIITGANMAGKSTFLRTVSLYIVMANMGLPVCARKSSYSPVKLITSMRTSDSLANDSSYFFSELSRLKQIIETIEKENYFIILDEILKGTNSEDKAMGSKKFVQKLVKMEVMGLIATHDLSLCELENSLNTVHNYYFDADIKNDSLYFDYTLKSGICKNMNASFLLKKMNII